MDEKFFIVPTPIGNLKDITLRAIEVLKSVDIIACEDTRVTQKLLNHYGIATKTIAYHKFNEKDSASGILRLIKDGKSVALVSDAGTPLVSDPGVILIEELRKNNIKYTALAGASAITTFLSQLPKGDEPFTFFGFLPKKDGKITEIVKDNSSKNFVFYESPNRLLKTLSVISKIDDNIKVAIGRELTKVYEEIFVGNVCEAISHFEINPLKGEIVVLVYKFFESTEDVDIQCKIDKLKAQGFSAKETTKIMTSLFDVDKKTVYNYFTES